MGVLTAKQQEEWDGFLESTKTDLMFHLSELLEQLEASDGTEVTERMQTNMRIVGDLLPQYSDRSDESKRNLFDPKLNELADLVLDHAIAKHKGFN